jgi:hypothetical protein
MADIAAIGVLQERRRTAAGDAAQPVPDGGGVRAGPCRARALRRGQRRRSCELSENLARRHGSGAMCDRAHAPSPFVREMWHGMQ